MPKSTFPSYKKPPVTEVACGIAFNALQGFNIPHYGAFWNRIRTKYPHTQHSMPLSVRPGELMVDVSSGVPLPRVWLVGDSKADLIQIQADCFYYNWRAVDGEKPYPRYPAVISAFKDLYLDFGKYVEQEKIGQIEPVSCELTYVNHIPKGEGWTSIQDIHKVFRDYRWNDAGDRFLPPPSGGAWQIVFDLPDSAGKLTARLSRVLRITDKAPALRLDLTAKGIGKDKSMDQIWHWFDIAHEWIVCGFADLTEKDIQQKIWEREDA